MHKSVLLEESIKIMNIKYGDTVIDATVGLGGHSKKILEKIGSNGKLIAIDWDERNLDIAKDNLKEFSNVFFIHSPFSKIKNVVNDLAIKSVNSIFFDFGVSSLHFDEEERGFSFRKNAKLDMRMNTKLEKNAYDVVNDYSMNELSFIFKEYGEEKYSDEIAKVICKTRKIQKIETTFELFDIIKNSGYHPIKVSTRIFQALRIEVNNELQEISKAIKDSFDVLDSTGVIATITFHSLEDKIIKNAFKEKSQKSNWEIINKKVIIPSYKETKENRRSKSAKLRAIKKIF